MLSNKLNRKNQSEIAACEQKTKRSTDGRNAEPNQSHQEHLAFKKLSSIRQKETELIIKSGLTSNNDGKSSKNQIVQKL